MSYAAQPGYVVYANAPPQPGAGPQFVAAPPQLAAAAGPQVLGQPQPAPVPSIVVGGQTFYAVPPPPAGAAQMQPQPQPAPAVVVQGGGGPPFMAGNAGPLPHEVSGIGRTPQEEVLRQVQFAYKNKLYEPQDFKPGDDDPGRFYYVREVDGNWTQRSRYTIDNMACRWYVTDEGWFYAVRLPD